jgi:3-dehydroquinate dehydratase / shikimate dehydrogenase
MAKICICLTGKTLAQDLEQLESNRKYVDLAELRVDCLDPDERFHIRRFPEMAGLPVILTVRRNLEGGFYVGGEGSRISLLAKGLAYAAADQRRNFAYVDLEEDLNVPSLEEAARTFGTRIIRSWHNMEGVDRDLTGKIKKLRRVGDELVKVSVTAGSLTDVVKVYKAARETSGIDKILICMGEYGVNTRILSEFLGSRISYTSIKDANVKQAAPGQLEPRVLSELYNFREITAKTKVYAIAGFPLKFTNSPFFFNTVFRMEQTDAVFIPIVADSVESLIDLAEEIGILGLSISVPYKERILPYLVSRSEKATSIGACNTLVRSLRGWMGYNTDAAGFSDSLLSFIGKKDLKGRKVTIIGAGGAAKAAAFEVHRLKGKALILNRTPARARNLAEPYRFAWAAFDSRGAVLMEKYSDIIIQASSVGMAPDTENDPIEFYKFSGKEIVMDFICEPQKTRCLRRAEQAGCKILNGSDMLQRQARYQYGFFMDREFPPSLVTRVKF